jgi:hypothetical protein
MSKFKVRLNNGTQGLLDINSSENSIQRSVYVSGPNRIYRQLKDGEIFEDSNYWKRYAYPQTSLELSFLEVLEDDGSVWSDYTENNNAPKAYFFSLNQNSSFEDNVLDIEAEENGFATFVQISNGAGDIKIRLNSSDTAVFSLKANETQIFSQGELNLNKIEFKNENDQLVEVQVITSVKLNYKT